VASTDVVITPVSGKKDLSAFIDLAYRLNADDPNFVPPLRGDMVELLTPGKNPFFEHATVQLFLARRGERVVGRISAHLDHLALAQPPEQGMGPGTGNWGLPRSRGRGSGPCLDRAGRGVAARAGHDPRTRADQHVDLGGAGPAGRRQRPPTLVMMGHDPPHYKGWVESAGYKKVQSLKTFDLEVAHGFPPIVNKIVEMGERNPRIRIRQLDKKHLAREADIVVDILNDAWSTELGFVPFTDTEIQYAARR